MQETAADRQHLGAAFEVHLGGLVQAARDLAHAVQVDLPDKAKAWEDLLFARRCLREAGTVAGELPF